MINRLDLFHLEKEKRDRETTLINSHVVDVPLLPSFSATWKRSARRGNDDPASVPKPKRKGLYILIIFIDYFSYRFQVFDSRCHAHGHFPPLRRRIRARIQSSAISRINIQKIKILINRNCGLPFADFLHAGTQLVSLEENDEDALVNDVTLKSIIN